MTLPPTSFAILGLLATRPSSGYDLAAFAERSIAHFWPISRSLVYRELSRLEDLGLVSAAEIAQERLPDKRVYRLSDEGRARLAGWLGVADFSPDRFRSEFLLRLFFAEHAERESLDRLLVEYGQRLEQRRRDLSAIVERLAAIPTARFARLTALHGLRTMEAEIAWLAEVEGLLLTAASPRSA